jgi:hypothetical protein
MTVACRGPTEPIRFVLNGVVARWHIREWNEVLTT